MEWFGASFWEVTKRNEVKDVFSGWKASMEEQSRMMNHTQRGPVNFGYNLRIQRNSHLPMDIIRLVHPLFLQQAGLRIISQAESAKQFGWYEPMIFRESSSLQS